MKKKHYKIKKSLIIILIFLMKESFYVHASTHFSILEDGRAFIQGSFDEIDMHRVINSGNPFEMRLETPNYDYFFEAHWVKCVNNKNDMINNINRMLSAGILSINRVSWGNRTTNLFMFCNVDNNTQWQMTAKITGNETPAPSSCFITPERDSINFGVVERGAAGVQKSTSLSVTCSKEVSGWIKVSAATNGIVRIGDASIKPQFSNSRSEISYKTLSRQAKIPLTVLVKDTGSASGEKSGALVLITEWD